MKTLSYLLLCLARGQAVRADGPFEQSELPYPFDALEPHLDAEAVETIYEHHKTYVKGLNAVAAPHGTGDAQDLAAYQQFAANAEPVRQNAGGHYNHALFMFNLAPEKDSSEEDISPDLMQKIKEAFGDVEGLKKSFTFEAKKRFGSGWVWLGVTPGKTLDVTSTANQDNPIMQLEYPYKRMLPILGLDLWEHAFFRQYPNERSEYVDAFWNIINWKKVSQNFEDHAAKGMVVPPTAYEPPKEEEKEDEPPKEEEKEDEPPKEEEAEPEPEKEAEPESETEPPKENEDEPPAE